MECPYCSETVADYDDFTLHVLKCHEDKTSLEEFRETKISRMWAIADSLTSTTFGNHAEQLDKEKVLETFKYFLRELMKSE